MSSGWQRVRLDDLLSQVHRDEAVDRAEEYRLLGVRWYGEGLFIRERKSGQEIQATRLNRVRAGDFVYNRLFAWKGSFALADERVDGCYVSNEFPCFQVDTQRLDPGFVRWYFQQAKTWTKALGLSIGATPTSRNRLKEAAFLGLEMPLPRLAEQQRIVTRIEEVARKIQLAVGLRARTLEEVNAVLSSATAAAFKPKDNWSTLAVRDFCEQPQYGYTESASREPIGPHFLRITDIQEGHVDWSSVPYCRCPEPAKYLLQAGDLVFARTGATTGKSYVIGDCPEAVFASYLIRLRVRQAVQVDYLYWYFQSPGYWAQIEDEKEGTGQPNLNGRKLARLRVPVASPSEQREIVANLNTLADRLRMLQRVQFHTEKEINALLPAVLDRAFKGEL